MKKRRIDFHRMLIRKKCFSAKKERFVRITTEIRRNSLDSMQKLIARLKRFSLMIRCQEKDVSTIRENGVELGRAWKESFLEI